MLEDLAKEIRKEIMLTACCGNTGHLASSFSAVEIMTALYFGDILCYDKEDPYWEDRDKVIISKGHATLVLYSVLKHIGYITQEQMEKAFQLVKDLYSSNTVEPFGEGGTSDVGSAT